MNIPITRPNMRAILKERNMLQRKNSATYRNAVCEINRVPQAAGRNVNRDVERDDLQVKIKIIE